MVSLESVVVPVVVREVLFVPLEEPCQESIGFAWSTPRHAVTTANVWSPASGTVGAESPAVAIFQQTVCRVWSDVPPVFDAIESSKSQYAGQVSAFESSPSPSMCTKSKSPCCQPDGSPGVTAPVPAPVVPEPTCVIDVAASAEKAKLNRKRAIVATVTIEEKNDCIIRTKLIASICITINYS